jgi:hypothetical protein
MLLLLLLLQQPLLLLLHLISPEVCMLATIGGAGRGARRCFATCCVVATAARGCAGCKGMLVLRC